jgi:hypothetical protein
VRLGLDLGARVGRWLRLYVIPLGRIPEEPLEESDVDNPDRVPLACLDRGSIRPDAGPGGHGNGGHLGPVDQQQIEPADDAPVGQ